MTLIINEYSSNIFPAFLVSAGIERLKPLCDKVQKIYRKATLELLNLLDIWPDLPLPSPSSKHEIKKTSSFNVLVIGVSESD
jgi:hypothetical protein